MNSKLQKKDIKVGITAAKLQHVQYNALAFAAFMCSQGFINAVEEAGIDLHSDYQHH